MFGQFSSEESASNPPLARAAISRNSQISEGLIRGQSSTVKVPIPDRRAELLEVTSFNFHFAVLVSPPVVFGSDSVGSQMRRRMSGGS